MTIIQEYLVALRPWSFTASIIPVCITAAVTNSSFLSWEFGRALAMAVFIHSGANLTNTYYDYVLGIDTKAYNHDGTLVEQKISTSGLFLYSIICYGVGILAILPSLPHNFSSLEYDTNSPEFMTLSIFAIGVLLAFGYTAGSFGLKYMALGDITIFLCFGSLLMECTCLMLTQTISLPLLYYSIPMGLLTEGILHVNNTRDIKNDRLSGIITLATLIDFENSFYFFVFLLIGSYLSAMIVAWYEHVGCLLVLLTMPAAWQLIHKFSKQQFLTLCEETAQFHLFFGVCLLIGIVSTTFGLETLFW